MGVFPREHEIPQLDGGALSGQFVAGCKNRVNCKRRPGVEIGMRSEVAGIGRVKPEQLPPRYWRWAEPKQVVEAKQVDGVELSLRARWMNQLMSNAPSRSERVEQIHADLKLGTYETPSKLDVALDRLIDDAAGEKHRDGIYELENGSNVSIVAVRPVEKLGQSRLQKT